MGKIIIAIDGYASCGKSTTARLVARELDYTYIDSGAMYRAITLYFLKNNIPLDSDNDTIATAISQITIDFKFDSVNRFTHTWLNGHDVEHEIRSPEVSSSVSQVSTLKLVREEMVKQQQRMGLEKGIVMDGRDIGTVVFPHAELKIFMTAGLEARALRRKQEMEAKGIAVTLDKIEENLRERDHIDSTREYSPLKQAADAIVIDTTDLSIHEQVRIVCDFAEKKIQSLAQ